MPTKITLFDDTTTRENLLPLTLTRPVAALRVGIKTIAEKWAHALNADVDFLTVDYLAKKFPGPDGPDETSLFIAGNIFPTPPLLKLLSNLQFGHALLDDNARLIAFNGTLDRFNNKQFSNSAIAPAAIIDGIFMLWDIFQKNGSQIQADFLALTSGRSGMPISDSCTIIGPRENLFIEPGATIEGAFINLKSGPVYVAENAEIMEGSCLRGPIAIGSHATVNMGTKIYGATTIGPHCKVGGELNNVVMIAFSNKAHDGFLGNAVIGEWCNLGAGCVASNLKNDYTQIKLWNYPAHRFLPTGLQFCGLIMGDHSKAGINTMFNTATVVGVGVNIHGSGFPRNFIPSFSEGSTAGFSDVSMTKFFQIAERAMARRDIALTETDRNIFYAIRDFADRYK